MNTFSNKLISWYLENRRALPWRVNLSGYRVWVSEIMLQQTRVESVIPYYKKWMARFPNVNELAKANQQEVLSLWEGLGYYSRARNMHKAARQVVEEHGGKLPEDIQALQNLPGIGRYTAGAIASIAFGMDAPVVDGNVKRVLARLFNVEDCVDMAIGESRIWNIAQEYLPPGKASEYNQGLMELGARICTPRNPKCDLCPLAMGCRAFELGNQTERPVRKAKTKIPTKYLAAAVIEDGKKVWLRQRPEKGLLGGMWEFPNIPVEQTEPLQKQVDRLQIDITDQLATEIKSIAEIGVFNQTYTHFHVVVRALRYSISNQSAEAKAVKREKWVWINDLAQYPMGKVDRQILQRLLE